MSIRSDIDETVHYARPPVKAICTDRDVHHARMGKGAAHTDQARRLRSARQQRGFATARAAATYFGWNYNSYGLHERGERGLTRSVAEKYARGLRTSAAWLLTGEGQPPTTVPIVGHAGASPNGAVAFGHGDDAFGEITAPPGSGPTTVAVEVRGDSMRGIAEDGWLIFYETDQRREPPTPDLIGHYCVVGLADERVLIKKLAQGRKKKHFDLESAAAPTLYDVEVTWAAPITLIAPRYTARRFSTSHS